MITYDPNWNKCEAMREILLTFEGRVVARRQFIDEAGFEAGQADLIVQRDRWHNSDQFRGRDALKIVVEGTAVKTRVEQPTPYPGCRKPKACRKAGYCKADPACFN